MKNCLDLFYYELKNLYSCEKQNVNALTKYMGSCSSSKLKDALHQHLKRTEEQVKRLEMIGKELKLEWGHPQNEVAKALIEETDRILKIGYEPNAKDAALINCIQHMELYEIASYGLLKAFAKHFHYEKIYDWLETSSKEEGHMNKYLNELAENSTKGINLEACKRKAA